MNKNTVLLSGFLLLILVAFVYAQDIESRNVVILTNESVNNKTVVIVVENSVLVNLTNEIQRFKQDIENDTRSEVIINSRNWSDEFQLRDYLSNLKNNHNLVGAILIGDVPYFKIITDMPPGYYYPSKEYVSDYPFWDLDISLKDDNNDKVIDEPPEDFLKNIAKTEIWIGRLKPPNENTKINDLRNYFNRNHDYRNGQTNHSGMIVFDSIIIFEGSMNDKETYYDTFRYQILNSAGPYTLDDATIFYENDSRIIKQEYFAHLNRTYEFAFLSFHGAPVYHSLAPGVTVNSSEIRTLAPKILFYYVGSCSVGKFNEEGYAAGQYLFSGDSLLITAVTQPVTSTVGTIPSLFTLNAGVNFGESNRYYMSPERVILGDPTLRLRNPPQNPPMIHINKDFIDFGYVNKGEEKIESFVITNYGNKTPLIINSRSLKIFLNNETHANSTGQRFVYDLPRPPFGPVDPNKSIQIPVSFIPDDTGLFTAELILVTNDPNIPYYKVNFRSFVSAEDTADLQKKIASDYIISKVGSEYFYKNFEYNRTVPYPEYTPNSATMVARFIHKITIGDYIENVKVSVWLEYKDGGWVVKSSGVSEELPDCVADSSKCMPFEITQERAIEIAKENGALDGAEKYTAGIHYFYGNVQSYVWDVTTFKSALNGKTAIIDLNNGKLISIVDWQVLFAKAGYNDATPLTNQQIPVTTTPSTNQNTQNNSSNNYLYLIIGVVVLLVIFFVILLLKTKKE